MSIGSLLKSRQLGIFVIIGVVIALVMSFNARLGDMARLQNRKATVAAQATGIMVTQEVLKTQEAFATSPEVVATYAHGEAHLAMPGDHVVIVLPVPGATPPPTPIPTPVVNDRNAWDIWMGFIFGN